MGDERVDGGVRGEERGQSLQYALYMYMYLKQRPGPQPVNTLQNFQ